MKKIDLKRLVLFSIVIFLSSVAVFSLSMSLSYVLKLTKQVKLQTETPKFHVAIYLPETSHSFFNLMLKGAEDFCAEEDVALSVHELDENSSQLFAAPYTSADGTVIYSFSDTKDTADILDKIAETSTPLVLIDHAIPTNKPYTHIGVNNFELGCYIGEYLFKEHALIYPLIVYSEKSPGMYAERELIEMGLKSTASYKLEDSILCAVTSQNMLDAEEIVSSLLSTKPRTNIIIFTNEDDTLAYAKMLVEQNKVGTHRIIGFGSSDAVKDYLEKGVLDALISVDAYQLGYQALQSVFEICQNGYTSSYVNTGFDFLKKSGNGEGGQK
ncbi:MAG: substrate-binding domain-containing protein [Spirochaetaceae bacterium]|nr:substrate-binding domain-containing protein [Spirochaetaceae bacterium]MBR3812454.1 substrate-binding domain-containing protein [Spirochaetaceae bacterium]MDD6486590.1 substrate-binding domain-containing protein [Spirochaetales bacterium]